MTQDQLAKELGVTRGYLSLLESARGKLPSVQVLRDLCDVLIVRGHPERSRSQLEQITRLSLAALDLENADLFEDVLGSIEDEAVTQRQPAVNEVWILSDILGETRKTALLETTVGNLTEGVRYVYFVPAGDGALQWEECKTAIAQKLKDSFEAVSQQLVAVSCPKLLCLPRMRILNPGLRTAQGTVSLGPLNDIVLHKLQPDQVATIHAELSRVLDALGTQSPYTTPDGATFTRLYPEEGPASA